MSLPVRLRAGTSDPPGPARHADTCMMNSDVSIDNSAPQGISTAAHKDSDPDVAEVQRNDKSEVQLDEVQHFPHEKPPEERQRIREAACSYHNKEIQRGLMLRYSPATPPAQDESCEDEAEENESWPLAAKPLVAIRITLSPSDKSEDNRVCTSSKLFHAVPVLVPSLVSSPFNGST